MPRFSANLGHLFVEYPQIGDVYLLCSDGLSKMVSDDVIKRILATADSPKGAVDALIQEANERGGKDNISVIVVRVDPPSTLAA